MAIYAIGHDIVENTRVEILLKRYKVRFINKILSAAEKDILATKTNQVRYLAKRFAAKEAFAKACGTGIRTPILMPNISVLNNETGQPYLVLDSQISQFLEDRGVSKYHLSLSDEINLSSAFVVLEKA